MKSETTNAFWQYYWDLPKEVRLRAQKAFKLWKDNPSHPSLFFKRVNKQKPIYSIRISLGYRALGLLKGDTITWFWIGSHEQYERLLK